MNGSYSAETCVLVEILTILYIFLFENGFHQGNTEKVSKVCIYFPINDRIIKILNATTKSNHRQGLVFNTLCVLQHPTDVKVTDSSLFETTEIR